MNDPIYNYHVSWEAERNGHFAKGFGHFESSVNIAPIGCYLYFVERVRADIASQLRASRKTDAFYETDNIKLISINYLGESAGDMEEK